MNDKIKGLVGSVLSLSQTISGLPGMEGFDGEIRSDLLNFMMYLSASDGVIAPEEVEAINAYVDTSFTPEQAKQYLDEHKIYTEAFEHKVPESVVKLVNVDNRLRQSDNPPEEDASEMMLDLFKSIGQEMIGSDGSVHISEETDMYIYLTTIDKYLTDNLISRKHAESGDVEIVAAPAKK